MKSPPARRSKKGSADIASKPPGVAQATRADTERLLDRMQEANERLIVAAVHAQNLSDEAHREAAQARVELDDLMSQLRAANEQLAMTTEEAREGDSPARRRTPSCPCP